MNKKSGKRILVTSALPYANGPIHLGHLAGAYLPADIFVRYHRLKRNDVVHICGSDENGVPILLRARAEKKNPQDIVDRYHSMIKKSFEAVGIQFDFYGRTSSKIHHETSRDFFSTLAKKDILRLRSDENLYDPEAKLFLADRFIYGTCPKCDFEKAYGDQCENCGTSLSQKELKNPKSALTDAVPIVKKTTHWHLPLDDLQDQLDAWLKTRKGWKQNVVGQVKSWLADGLRERAVTRDLPWGVPVPKDVAEKAGVDVSGKVLYVWFDAPIGYISATREWAAQKGDPEMWKKYWQDKDTTLVHFIGKDNIVFHCLIFPAMLMAHGDYVLPENVPANEFLNIEGDKLSTSRNYAVWLHDYLQKFEPDTLRYSLISNMPETRDADFSWKELQARHNNELADILGNLVNRTFTFIAKYYNGKLPPAAGLEEMDNGLIAKIAETRDRVGNEIERFHFKEATKKAFELARAANKYFNDQEPWRTRKDAPERCATALNLCVRTIHALAVIIDPILPFTAQKIWDILNLEGSADTAFWDDIGSLSLPEGHRFGELEILFKKIEDAPIQQEVDRLQTIKKQMMEGVKEDKKKVLPKVPEISIDDFSKVDLRVAEVIAAERLKGADRLLKLRVSTGAEERQVIAGIATSYKPDELIGKRVVIVANLKPVKLRGEMSEGMILAAETSDGKMCIVSPQGGAEPGTQVK